MLNMLCTAPADQLHQAEQLRQAAQQSTSDSAALAVARTQLAAAQQQLQMLKPEAASAMQQAELMHARAEGLQVGLPGLCQRMLCVGLCACPNAGRMPKCRAHANASHALPSTPPLPWATGQAGGI